MTSLASRISNTSWRRTGSGRAWTGHELAGGLVRRDSVSILGGGDSHPASVVPAGSNRSGGGGNEIAGAGPAVWGVGQVHSTVEAG